MSTPRIAINGFGRIGRTITRIAKLRGRYDVIAINDLASAEDYITNLTSRGKSRQDAVASFVQILFSSTEFRFID